MNSIVVGGVIKRVYDGFDMNSFSNRLRLQKTVYLLEEVAEINLGYSFSLYAFGPYSVELTRDAFEINNFDEIKKVSFEDDAIEENFKVFLEKLGDKKNDDEWLEITSSIHLMKSLYPMETKEEIIERIKTKREGLKEKEEEIKKVWEEIDGWII